MPMTSDAGPPTLHQRIEVSHFTRNPASGRVMEKLGMRLEGVRRRHVVRDGVAEDLALRSILIEEHRPR